jgi:hypothetical protein
LLDLCWAPTFLTSWVHVPATLPCFPTFSSLSHTFPIIKFILFIIFVMACIGNLSSTSGGGGVLFCADMIVPAKLVSGKKKLSSRRSCFAQTLLISSHAHTSRLTFLRNWNQHQIEPTWQRNPNIYMTQEAIKTRKRAKQNCDDSLVSSKRVYPKYEWNWRLE